MGSYEQKNDKEQLGQKLLCTTLQLEKLREEAMQEMIKNKQYTKQLIHLLKYAIHERDEARSHFQKLLNHTVPLIHSDAHLLKPAESNSQSDAYSLVVDSLFDVDPSPEYSDINFVSNHSFIQVPPPAVAPQNDEQSLIIDSIASGRVLPEKGKLLKAVLQSGPLLQSLLALPRWRNPPHCQAFQVPVKGDPSEVISYTPPSDVGQLSDAFSFTHPSDVGQMSVNYGQMSCGSAQIQTGPMLAFADSGLGNYYMSNTSGYGLKRQRFY